MASHQLDESRVAVLRGYGVLDTAREPRFDSITRLLAAICDTPIAFVSLIDGTRQWFKSIHGVDWEQTDRSVAFCNHTIEQPGLFVVEDAHADPRFATNPLVCGDERIRFYAGVPLLNGDHVALGALAVVDRVPRQLDALQTLALQTLADQVMALIEAHRRQQMLEQALLQRERTQAALRDSQDRWRLLFDRNPMPMWVADAETLRFLAVNDAAVVHYGWSHAEFGAMTVADIHPQEDRPALLAAIDRGSELTDSGKVWRHRRKNGQPMQVAVTVHSVPFDGRDGRLTLALDVTEQQHAEQALRSSHARWERLFAASATGISLSSPDGVVLSVNPALCKLVGRSAQDVLGRHMLTFTHPGDIPAFRQALAGLIAGEQDSFTIEKRLLRPDGSAVWARTAVTMTEPGDDAGQDGAAPGEGRSFVAVVQDVDTQHTAQEALQRSHDLLDLAGRMARLGGWAVELSTVPGQADHVVWSEQLLTILDCPPHHSPSVEESLSWYCPGSRERVTRALQDCLTHGTPFDLDLELVTPAGRSLAVRGLGQPIHDAAGRIVGASGALHDLSDRHLAEERLREQAALLEAAPDAISVTDLERRIRYWSRGAEEMFGWTQAEAIGRRLPDLLQQEPEAAASALAEVLARGEWTSTLRQHHKDGRVVVAEVRWTLLRDAAGQPSAVLAIKTDVTQRLALQTQLQQAQRLEAVGQLTGGVAHDFNNLLTVILGNAELLSEMLQGQPQLQSLAQMVRSAAERGAELTQRMLAFARKQPLQPQAVDAHELLAGMDALLRRTLPENIRLELVRAGGLWLVQADPVQLESALLNLVLNARDAMPDGGCMTLETANATIDEDFAARHADMLPGDYVLLTLTDTGSGMTPQQIARAFEPFYTTKAVGKGSGLGLSMVWGFARQSHGHVKLYSEPGEGTAVHLYLPRSGKALADRPPAGTSDMQDLRGSERVLVVEDDELVRRHASELLASLGYSVLAAEHGAAAMAVLSEHADIALLFTDVVMPGGMNGRQLAEAALALRPGLKVLYTSGYTEDAIVHHGRPEGGVRLLAKPYRIIDLARQVRAALRAKAPAESP